MSNSVAAGLAIDAVEDKKVELQDIIGVRALLREW